MAPNGLYRTDFLLPLSLALASDHLTAHGRLGRHRGVHFTLALRAALLAPLRYVSSGRNLVRAGSSFLVVCGAAFSTWSFAAERPATLRVGRLGPVRLRGGFRLDRLGRRIQGAFSRGGYRSSI